MFVHIQTANSPCVSCLSSPLSLPWQPLQMCLGWAQFKYVHVRSLAWLIDQPFHFWQFPYVQAPIPVESCHVPLVSLVLRLRISGAEPPIPLCAFGARTETFPFLPFTFWHISCFVYVNCHCVWQGVPRCPTTGTQ